MGRYIIKIQDYYLEWSTIVDAPVTFGMKLDQFREYYKNEYGENGIKDFNSRIARVNKKGTSSYIHDNERQVVANNNAGPNYRKLTYDEIYQAYCLCKPIDGWLVPTVEKESI